ncbi:MAG: DeoR/GlpR family DNA-binding transcription regulator [Planctomycetaceae bacterium]|nr:DeoR/GlpR family DNA-binding transcription regulator [Planctomycetaceae bacterium]
MPELAEPRQQAILELINTGGHAVVSSLAKQFDVSEMTIRRDLNSLEEQGLAVRVHGGALAAEKSRFSIRLSANARDKARAVAKVAPNLPHQGCIYFDGSTTVLNLVKMLKNRPRLQVATNNVETFNTIAALNGPAPILLGGTLDIRTDNLIGPLALRSIETLAFEQAYFSAWGLDAELGLNEATMEDALVKDQVARRTQSVYVALDHSKLGVVAGGTWSHGPAKTVLATDLDPGDKRLAPFHKIFKDIL